MTKNVDVWGAFDPLNARIACHYTHLSQAFDERHIKTLSQRIMTTYLLLIAIEYALKNWPLMDYRKNSSFFKNHAGLDANLAFPPT